MNKIFKIGLVLSAFCVAACGDDGGSDTGDTDTGDSTTTASTTTDPGTTSTTDPSTSTTDPTASSSTTDPTDGTGGGSTGGAGEAQIRVMHLGVNVPNVDVFANGAGPAFTDLAFGDSTEYATLAEGAYTFEVAVTGDPVEDAVLTPMVTLDADTLYTAVAIGDLNETDMAPAPSVIALVDDPDGIDAANVRIQVVHAAPAVGQVDIYEATDGANLLTLAEDVDFSGAATLMDLPAATYVIGLDLDNDTGDNGDGLEVTFTVDTSAAAGVNVNAYASNDDQGDVSLILQLPDGNTLGIDPD